jgi:hypothetical protein
VSVFHCHHSFSSQLLLNTYGIPLVMPAAPVAASPTTRLVRRRWSVVLLAALAAELAAILDGPVGTWLLSATVLVGGTPRRMSLLPLQRFPELALVVVFR